MSYTLIYCYDPMCSWCWGFKPTWESLKELINPLVKAGKLNIEYRVGGLAPDSDQPMPVDMQNKLQSTWRNISEQLGTEFNHDFWRLCRPRRSTYPACRACLVARELGLEEAMILQIQQAYYLQAKNPSDLETLIACGENIGIKKPEFLAALKKIETNKTLEQEIERARQAGLNSFPSLAVQYQQSIIHIPLDYQSPETMLTSIQYAINRLSE